MCQQMKNNYSEINKGALYIYENDTYRYNYSEYKRNVHRGKFAVVTGHGIGDS